MGLDLDVRTIRGLNLRERRADPYPSARRDGGNVASASHDIDPGHPPPLNHVAYARIDAVGTDRDMTGISAGSRLPAQLRAKCALGRLDRHAELDGVEAIDLEYPPLPGMNS